MGQNNIKKIINAKLIHSKINVYLIYYFNKNKKFNEQLLDISIDNENIFYEEKTEFTRRIKKYIKSIIFYIFKN